LSNDGTCCHQFCFDEILQLSSRYCPVECLQQLPTCKMKLIVLIAIVKKTFLGALRLTQSSEAPELYIITIDCSSVFLEISVSMLL
jgi:hypothetical protein